LIGYLATGNDAAIERELQTVLDLFETHRNRIIDEQNRNSFFDAEQSVYDLAIGYELSRGRDELAFDYSETSRARSLLDSLHYAPQRAAGNEIADLPFRSMTTAQGFAQLREQLPAGIQIVQYALLENSLAIWVLSRDGLSVVQRPIARNEFAERVNLYERLITSRHADDADKLRDTASSLYEILIDPIVGKLNQGQPICVIPDKLLFQLSFGSLWSKEAGKYFIEQFPIFISSSLNVLVQCSKAAAAHPATNDEALLGIGNPSFDRAAHPDLSDLPDAVREVSAIAAVYPRTISLTSGAATKNAVEKYLYASDIVHFAGHYFIDSSDSLRSGLLLAPEPARSGGDEALTAQDVFALKLTRPKLIVLSACETTGEKYYGGEGIVGMATTFLAAGVPLVVASQWPVDSNATADLMIAFHNYRRNGYSTISALRQAQIDMIRGSKNADRPPYSWAAFIPIGGFATF
jgi:CHAT domain-containing protein